MAVVSQSLPAELPLFLYPCLREYLSGLALNCLDWATSFPRRGRRLGGGTSFELISFSSLLPQKQQPRSAALKLDWVKVSSSLGLRGQTAASLQAFKQRNETARRRLQALSEQPTAVDFAHYRSVLKNQAVVNEVERRFKDFKPAAYDVQRQLKAIDAFEVEAVRNAQAAKEKVDLELKDLEATLTNIETARPFDELTVVRVERLILERWLSSWLSTRGRGRGREGLLLLLLSVAAVSVRVSVLVPTVQVQVPVPGYGLLLVAVVVVVVTVVITDKTRMLTQNYRTKLLPLSRASTRRPPSWCPRAVGQFRDTRYDTSFFRVYYMCVLYRDLLTSLVTQQEKFGDLSVL